VLINEIFHSIQGESTFAGRPCVFVRVTGCALRCVWCDTTYAYHEGVEMDLEAVIARVSSFSCPLVEITGGEPLESPDVPELVRRLLDLGHEVLVETGGHRDISLLDRRSRAILDVKCPNSGMVEAMDWANLERLWPGCEVKFVLSNRADYAFARDLVRQNSLDRFPVLFSPVHDGLDPRELAEWMLADGVNGRLQLQVHKFIWDPETRGV
jgi:7-carboxy-7-deazaguanine synthase